MITSLLVKQSQPQEMIMSVHTTVSPRIQCLSIKNVFSNAYGFVCPLELLHFFSVIV